ncbi:MAG: GNAT family N-acetyltransferase [Armatimonadota bacterium]|nr:GNAT family N-acetyltransferase [Armatimonadota bacterium]
MNDIPTLKTKRLTLRPWRTSDAEAVFAYASDPETTRYMVFDTHTSIADSREFLSRAPTSEEYGFAVTVDDDDIAVGGCGIRPTPQHRKAEVGYILHKSIWGNGYATELTRELIRHGFEDLNLGRIYARTDERNIGSVRVMEKAGMTYEGVLREDMVLRGEPCNHLMYSILRSEYDAMRALVCREIATPVGTLYAAASAAGLVRLDFEEGLATDAPGDASLCRAHLDSIEAELTAYFAGDLRAFTTPVVFVGTAFQRMVWNALRSIPYGVTITYAQLATAIGSPAAIRAAAAANGANLLSIIVPCHRVIASDGKMQGYRGGVERKRFLIDFERGQSALF